jgi:hypothetical protein
VQKEHSVFNAPAKIGSKNGEISVLKKMGKKQSEMGEALTLDGFINSIDAEVIATGPSAKGNDRGAITRHGSYVLWSFEGAISDMTEEGKKLFINTVFYTAKLKYKPVLEKKLNQTRDGLEIYLDLAKNINPAFLNTMKSYLPEDMKNTDLKETELWFKENRPFLYSKNRRFEIDKLAKKLNIPNHSKKLIEKCISNIKDKIETNLSLETIFRYIDPIELGSSCQNLEKWYAENNDYLYFTDSEGFKFKVDAEAKAKGIPTEKLRNWSSENIDYRIILPSSEKVK